MFEDFLNFMVLFSICVVSFFVGVKISIVGLFLVLFCSRLMCMNLGSSYLSVLFDLVFVMVIMFWFCMVIGYDWVWMGVGFANLVRCIYKK